MAIVGKIVGDSLEYNVRLAVPQAITKAWLTVGADVVNKIITISNVAGTGQIVNDGGTTGYAILRFDFSAANTTSIGTTRREYDVQVKFADGNLYTRKSYIQLVAGLTDETS